MAQNTDKSFTIKDRNGIYDSTYIETYPHLITGRVLFSQKSTNLTILNNKDKTSLDYLPNTTLNFGVGATVNSLSLNLAYGFRFLNPDEGQGTTRYLDLQSHVYTRKLIVDLYGQFYKGMYLENTRSLDPDYQNPYYVRPDIYEQILGFTGFYVFNNQKFSYRAALIQNERQLKSSGSFLAGFETYYGLVKADSSIVPTFIKTDEFENIEGYDKLSFLKIGPSAGYTYTLVVAEKFFAMVSLTFNFGMGVNNGYERDRKVFSDFQLGIGTIGRFAIGFNNSTWYLGLSGIDNVINTTGESRLINADYGISNVRINFVKRFSAGPKLKPFFDKIP